MSLGERIGLLEFWHETFDRLRKWGEDAACSMADRAVGMARTHSIDFARQQFTPR